MAPTNDEESGATCRDSNHDGSDFDEHSQLRDNHDFEDVDTTPSTPRFLQDEGSWKGWTWVPTPCRRIGGRIVKWAKGPDPPQIQRIQPILPTIQELPMRLLDKFVPKTKDRIILLLVFYMSWITTFGLVLRQSTFASQVADYGVPVNLGCGNTFWFAANLCGTNGDGCRPFRGESFAFRCPADCGGYQALNPRAVGAQEVIYRPMVVGGAPEDDPAAPALYRGDSVICGSAIHDGVINDASGGCGVVSTVGRGADYPSTKRNKILSIGFDSHFPKSFTFTRGVQCEAKDLRWPLFGISFTYTAIFSLFCTQPALYFFTIFTATFAHTGFASDPPNHQDLTDLSSNLLGKFLPAMFCAFVMYKYSVRKTLTGLTAQVEKTILWLGMLWVGVLTNYTFRWLPIQRLTAHDLEQQPGAKLALALIIVLLVCIVVQQVYYFRLEGRLIRYLGLYGLFVLAILISLCLPGLNLRIHHYILALLLVPGTAMQTRPVLAYQGLLIGLFINGIARWGFDPVLQTSAALQGDAVHNSLLPSISEPLITLSSALLPAPAAGYQSIAFNFTTPLPDTMDGISVLVNDVERFRGYVDYETGEMENFMWTRKNSLPEYFRFAYMEGRMAWDYTKAGIWQPDGEWTHMEAGPSRVMSRKSDDGDDDVYVRNEL